MGTEEKAKRLAEIKLFVVWFSLGITVVVGL